MKKIDLWILIWSGLQKGQTLVQDRRGELAKTPSGAETDWLHGTERGINVKITFVENQSPILAARLIFQVAGSWKIWGVPRYFVVVQVDGLRA